MVAGRRPGDRSAADVTNGAIEGQESIAPVAGTLDDGQMLADADRTLDRRPTSRQHEHTAQARLDAAERCDAIADERDVAALAREQAADARDLAMAQHDAAYVQDLDVSALTGADRVIRAAGQRRRAAQRRIQAAAHRELAAQDRQAAAADREQAARERRRALVDREMLARQLAIAEADALSRARPRAAGLLDLDREVDRCRRTNGLLAVASVIVVEPKTLEDHEGPGVADALLTRVMVLVTRHLRTYDLIVRLADVGFLCVMPNMTLLHGRERFSAIAALAAAPDAAAITIGLAELSPHESAAELIARAARDGTITGGATGLPPIDGATCSP